MGIKLAERKALRMKAEAYLVRASQHAAPAQAALRVPLQEAPGPCVRLPGLPLLYLRNTFRTHPIIRVVENRHAGCYPARLLVLVSSE